VAWEEDGEVWVAASDPVDPASSVPIDRQLDRRRAIDAALLDAIGPDR
jgi:hypothetical protein